MGAIDDRYFGCNIVKPVLSYGDFKKFPEYGDAKYLYYAKDNGVHYKWNNSTGYVVYEPTKEDYEMENKIKESQSTGAGGKKDDAGKLKCSLLIPKFINGIIRVLEFGLVKYEKNSWQKVVAGETRYFDALKRHWDAMIKDDGTIDLDSRDEESGLPHLWHLQCNAYFLELFRIKQVEQKDKVNENT